VIVLLVNLEVLGELVYPLGGGSVLELGRTGVGLVRTVIFDNSCFLLFCDHFLISFLLSMPAG